MSLTQIIHSNRRYEDKFKKINKHIDFRIEKNIDVINSEILYLKNQRNNGRLKNAINQTYRKINYLTVDNTIEKLQSYRNELVGSSNLNKYKEIENIINGKNSYKLEDRFNEIENYIDNNSINENEKDSIRYVLLKLDNYYMKKKASTDLEFRKKREKLKKKLEEKLYYKKKKIKSKHKFRNLKYGIGIAASLLFGSLILNNYNINKPKVKKNNIEIVKEKNVEKKVIKYTDIKKEIPKTYTDYRAVIDKSDQKMYVLGNCKGNWDKIKAYKVSTGRYQGNKTRRGDNKTPEGNFKIIQKQNSSNWYYKGQKAYGPYFLRINSKWGDIGIHGTNEPEKLGERASHGCIRMLNKDLIDFLDNYAKLGTKIEIK